MWENDIFVCLNSAALTKLIAPQDAILGCAGSVEKNNC